MTPRVLTVEPTGGLANRMRVVDSAATLAERLDSSLTVLWTRTPDLGARFRELFEPLPGIRVFENAWTTSRLWRRSLRLLGYYRPYLDQAAVETRLRAAHDPGNATMRGLQAELQLGLQSGRRPFVITCSRLTGSRSPLKRFVPVPSLRREIAELTQGFGPSTLGVHVRRGDHDAARRSSTEGFIAWMRSAQDEDQKTCFFLATDSPEDEARLVQTFPGRVVTRRKSYARDRREGVRDALVDLYGLAGTRRIAGSYFSSFSEAASELGGVELVVVDGAPPQ